MLIIYDHIAHVMSIFKLSVHITDDYRLHQPGKIYMLSFGCPAEDSVALKHARFKPLSGAIGLLRQGYSQTSPPT